MCIYILWAAISDFLSSFPHEKTKRTNITFLQQSQHWELNIVVISMDSLSKSLSYLADDIPLEPEWPVRGTFLSILPTKQAHIEASTARPVNTSLSTE